MDFIKGFMEDTHKKVRGMTTNLTNAREALPPEYQSRAINAINGDVKMFSGCKDSQTSADVSDVTSFGLPKVSAAESAGGACTNSLLATLKTNPSVSFAELLVQMQAILKKRGYTQIPQLSSSRQVNLRESHFTTMNPQANGRTKALLIGINYTGHTQGELSGCVNDVKMMRDFIISQGFDSSPQRMRVLTDDRSFTHGAPNGDNILAAMQWLVADAQPGDSLFFHYSGHGSQMPDDDGDEEDGMDETLVPVDYQTGGMIRDDTIYKIMVAPLKEGVHMLAVFDCCHSGTILDLPFIFSATESGVEALNSGSVSFLGANPFFNFDAAFKAASNAVQEAFKSMGGLTEQLKRGLF